MLTGAASLVARAGANQLLVGFALAHAAVYLYLRPFTLHGWHLYPEALAAVACAAVALERLIGASPRILRAAGGVFAAAFLAVALWTTAGFARGHDASYWVGARHAAYLDVAKYLRAHAAPGEYFVCLEVGTIGYYSDVLGWDLGGIVNLRSDMPDSRRLRFLVLPPEAHHRAPSSRATVLITRRGAFEVRVYDLRTPWS